MIASLTNKWQTLINSDQLVGTIWHGLAGGLAGGLTAGVIARLVMRAFVLVSGGQPGFSLEGSFFIIWISTVLGGVLGIVFGLIQPFLPGSVRLKGFMVGLGIALLVAAPELSRGSLSEAALVPNGLRALLTALAPLAYGLVLGMAADRLAPRGSSLILNRQRAVRTAAFITLILALTGAVVELILALTHPAIIRFGSKPANSLALVAEISALLIVLTATLGMLVSVATGDRRLGKIGLAVSLLTAIWLSTYGVTESEGFGLTTLPGQIKLVTGLSTDTVNWLLLIPALGGVVGLLVAGAEIFRARRWDSWRRYVPLLIGLFPFLGAAVLYLASVPALMDIPYAGRELIGHWLSVVYFLTWLALGLALLVEAGLIRRAETD
jgi:hypothetical protein